VVDLLLTLAVALVLGLIVFGVVAFTLGKTAGLEPASPDAAPFDLPADSAVTPADLGAVRFDVVARGYRMDEVDTVLERLTYDLGVRDEEIRALRAELRDSRAAEREPLDSRAAELEPLDSRAAERELREDDATIDERHG
jgi:DivIVA domain-containing protein